MKPKLSSTKFHNNKIMQSLARNQSITLTMLLIRNHLQASLLVSRGISVYRISTGAYNNGTATAIGRYFAVQSKINVNIVPHYYVGHIAIDAFSISSNAQEDRMCIANNFNFFDFSQMCEMWTVESANQVFRNSMFPALGIRNHLLKCFMHAKDVQSIIECSVCLCQKRDEEWKCFSGIGFSRVSHTPLIALI